VRSRIEAFRPERGLGDRRVRQVRVLHVGAAEVALPYPRLPEIRFGKVGPAAVYAFQPHAVEVRVRDAQPRAVLIYQVEAREGALAATVSSAAPTSH
jgi:hypothetical protein